MPSTQLKCLNAGLRIGQNLRAAFSTTRIACAEGDITSASDLFSALKDSEPKSRPSRPSPQPSTHRISSPINIPNRRSTLRNTPAGGSGSHDRLTNLIGRSELKQQKRMQAASDSGERAASTTERLKQKELSEALSKQIMRPWKAGDVYAPHDLSWQEQDKWSRPGKKTHDVFDTLNINPLDHYRNFSIMSEYMTPMGRIKKRGETHLRPVNQRKIAKAIRRSIGIGMMPSVHRHPEILQKTIERAERQSHLGTPFSRTF